MIALKRASISLAVLAACSFAGTAALRADDVANDSTPAVTPMFAQPAESSDADVSWPTDERDGYVDGMTDAATDAGGIGRDDESPAAARRNVTHSVYIENDSPIFKPNGTSDRQYTSGVGLRFTFKPDWVRGFANVLTLEEFPEERTAFGINAGHQIFAPDNLHKRTLILDDRPYAGYLFGGVHFQRSNEITADHVQIDMGVVGPSSQADHIQKAIHKTIGGDDPRGWDNQLDDEFAFQTYLRKKWRVDLNPMVFGETKLDAQLIPHVNLAAGTVHRFLEAGGTLRIGVQLPDDFGPDRFEDIGDFTGNDIADRFSLYGFVRGTGRVVEHNMFLEGNTWKDSHGVDAKALVGELQAGAVLQYRFEAMTFAFGYSQTFRSEQFDGQKSTHSFGAWVFQGHLTF